MMAAAERGSRRQGSNSSPSGEFNPYRGECGFYAPDIVKRQRDLCDGAKLVYESLVRYAGKDGHCYPSQQRLAEDLGKSDRQIRRDVKGLVDAGLIRIDRDNRRQSNRYVFLLHSMFDRTHVSYQSNPEQPAKAELTGHIRPLEEHMTGQIRPLKGGVREDMDGTLRGQIGHFDRTDMSSEFSTGIQRRESSPSSSSPPIARKGAAAAEVSTARFEPDAEMVSWWRQTDTAIREHFPAVDDGILRQLVRVARTEFHDVDDVLLAAAVRKTYRPNQRSPGMWLTAVPEVLRTHFRQKAEVS